LDISGPLLLEDDLAERINEIAINQSENGTLGLTSTRTFRQTIFAKANPSPQPLLYHPPMANPLPSLMPAFWNEF
jgi:hypothetical protein